MKSLVPATLRGCALLLCLTVVSCGGGGGDDSSGSSSSTGSTPPTNVATVTVDSGPAGVNAVNTLFTSVTVCVPSTSTCQTIDNIQVDTGSYGLRLLSSALTLSLPVVTAAAGGGLVECTEFVDGYSWGPVALVDLQIAGESASSVPTQIIGDSRYPTAPDNCSSVAPQAENTVTQFGANGIIGIGPFAQDCGEECTTDITEPTIQYYGCTTSTQCQGTLVPVASQVQNPVSMFAVDNNGSMITLPSVSSTGATSVTGTLIFGIDTESNNASGSETVVPISDMGYVTSTFNGQTLDESFVDSGSNATYFNDENSSGGSNITECQTSGSTTPLSVFYCPASTMSLTAAFVLSDDSTANASFLVANPSTASSTVTAYPGLAATNPTASSFDWGLPFFYGRRVAFAIEGAATSVGTGPYIAF